MGNSKKIIAVVVVVAVIAGLVGYFTYKYKGFFHLFRKIIIVKNLPLIPRQII